MKQLFKKPSYYLISSAMDGNEKAIEKLLAFYDPYISKCCLRSLYDEYGNVYIVVDMELKGRIREALIKMILGFDNDLNDGKLSEETLEKEDLKRKSAILLPKDFVEQKSTSDYREFMEYLLKKYPVQTTKALEQVSNVTAEDLEEILNSIEDVREERTKSAVQLFNKREEELNKIYEKHKERIR